MPFIELHRTRNFLENNFSRQVSFFDFQTRSLNIVKYANVRLIAPEKSFGIRFEIRIMRKGKYTKYQTN